ncbi:MAG: dihydroorotate dehydrogenase [Deltaproteobacteria bacterium]|nr:MAG: dihydroorotate dehydrogenase [Deltaproteobacteria bacterium]
MAVYNIRCSYEENLAKGPNLALEDLPFTLVGQPRYEFWGKKLNSRLGIPAGLLLDSRWVRLYARLGFDILAYKTVRTRPQPSLPHPNCLLVAAALPCSPKAIPESLTVSQRYRPVTEISMTNSLGMPSQTPEVWQPDLVRSKESLLPGQMLIVSVVGTAEDNQPARFIQDFVRAAALAAEAGAEVIELNFSCPNAPVAEGQIYEAPEFAGQITKAVRQQVKELPLLIKIGYLAEDHRLARLLAAVRDDINGIVAINSLKLIVLDQQGRQALPGAGRSQSGVSGYALKELARDFIRRLVELKQKERYDFKILAAGGILTPGDFEDFLNLGAEAALTCTGAMWDPYLALRYHLEYSLPSPDPGPLMTLDFREIGLPSQIDEDIKIEHRRGDNEILYPPTMKICPICGEPLDQIPPAAPRYCRCRLMPDC